jgi:hypothetical protein
MHAPRADRLLEVWEDTRQAHPIRQALGLLEAAWPEIDATSWAQLPVGVRDAHLLALHDAWFGTELQTVTNCEACGSRLEPDFGARDIRTAPVAEPNARPDTLRHDGYEVEYRLPNSDDMLAIASIQDLATAQQTLLQRCVGWIRCSDGAPAEHLPDGLAARIGAEMSRQDPGADIELRLRCPVCDHEQSAIFDIVDYLRGELDDWAQRTLADVHLLARAYGWSEHEILALSPARRQLYVEMVRA